MRSRVRRVGPSPSFPNVVLTSASARATLLTVASTAILELGQWGIADRVRRAQDAGNGSIHVITAHRHIGVGPARWPRIPSRWDEACKRTLKEPCGRCHAARKEHDFGADQLAGRGKIRVGHRNTRMVPSRNDCAEDVCKHIGGKHEPAVGRVG
eukprot:scaffold36980_cov29-Tisochrysis_lutea.AAC.3